MEFFATLGTFEVCDFLPQSHKDSFNCLVFNYNTTGRQIGLTAEEVISICRDNGFEVREQSDGDPYNYLLIFGKAGKKKLEEMPEDKYFHGERKQYSDIDDLIKKTLEDRRKRRKLQLGL